MWICVCGLCLRDDAFMPLGEYAELDYYLKPPLRLPVKVEDEINYEILVVYNSKIEDLRAQRFYFEESDSGHIGWQIAIAGQLPDYFLNTGKDG